MHYFRQWGLKGLKIYFAIRKKNPEVISIEIPEIEAPIYLRAKTSDVYSFQDLFAHQCYAISDIDPGSVEWVLDCGANAGHAAVFFANRYPKAQIISIEPEDSNIELIRKNTEAYDRVKVLQTAIWSKTSTLKIKNTEASKWAFQVVETDSNDADGFEAIGINELVQQYAIPRIDVLKLDVEGAELAVFTENYMEWLAITRFIIIELHDRFAPGCTDAFMKAIAHRKHKIAQSGENLVVSFLES